MTPKTDGDPQAQPALGHTAMGQAILWLTTAAMLIVSFDVAVNPFGGRSVVAALQVVTSVIACALAALLIVTRARTAPPTASSATPTEDDVVIDLRDSSGAMKPVAQAVVRHHAALSRP